MLDKLYSLSIDKDWNVLNVVGIIILVPSLAIAACSTTFSFVNVVAVLALPDQAFHTWVAATSVVTITICLLLYFMDDILEWLIKRRDKSELVKHDPSRERQIEAFQFEIRTMIMQSGFSIDRRMQLYDQLNEASSKTNRRDCRIFLERLCSDIRKEK